MSFVKRNETLAHPQGKVTKTIMVFLSLLIGIFQRISEMACLPMASIVFRLEQVQTNFVIRVRLTVRHLLEVLFYPFSSFA